MNKVETGGLFLTFGLVAGAVVGAYTMTVIYGEPPSERIAPSERCPPPPPCEACPPAPSCSTAVPMVEMDPDEVTPIDIPASTEAGLPGSAVSLAMQGFSRELGTCRGGAAVGTLVLDLTITASAGFGRISTVALISSEGNAAEALACLETASKRVQFEWTAADGRTKLRYPLSLDPEPEAESP